MLPLPDWVVAWCIARFSSISHIGRFEAFVALGGYSSSLIFLHYLICAFTNGWGGDSLINVSMDVWDRALGFSWVNFCPTSRLSEVNFAQASPSGMQLLIKECVT